MQRKKFIPVIVGPTASGKSSLAIELAKQNNLEIISADSMQIYKNLDVGTAKVSLEEQALVKHHLINILDESENYSVYDFQKDANEIIKMKNGNVLICGGSSQYICSLIDGDKFINDTDYELRQELESKFSLLSNEDLWEYLASIDSERANKLEKNDRRRVLRAIEKYVITGIKPSNLDPKKFSKRQTQDSDENFYDFLCFYIDIDRKILYERINSRVDRMIENGLLDEAHYCYELMLNNKLSNTCKQAIAYKEFFPYFLGESSLEQCIEKLKINSRHYAKRQITWWKKRENKYVINGLSDHKDLLNEINKIIKTM